ncbi:alanine racemase, N-terminal domain protein [Mycobacterium xenopi 3993]|nr:alanine racemase, N-terminal domain protein [Mycobacterium xenopi 3993]
MIPKSADLLAEAVVDLDAIAHNVAVLRDRAGSAQVMAVVKADGYGHGATRVARTALAAGATELGVATVDEALELRADGITAPVLAWLHRPEPTSPARWPPTCRSRCPRCASSTSCLTRFAAPVPRRR